MNTLLLAGVLPCLALGAASAQTAAVTPEAPPVFALRQAMTLMEPEDPPAIHPAAGLSLRWQRGIVTKWLVALQGGEKRHCYFAEVESDGAAIELAHELRCAIDGVRVDDVNRDGHADIVFTLRVRGSLRLAEQTQQLVFLSTPKGFCRALDDGAGGTAAANCRP